MGPRNLHPFAQVLLYAVFLLITLVLFFPFVWMAYSSFKADTTEILTQPWSLPREWHWENYRLAVERGNLHTYIGNSLLVTAATVALVLSTASAAAYAFARHAFHGRDGLFLLFLIGLILPVESYLIPLFLELRTLDLIDSRLGLVLAYSAASMPLAVFILRSFMMTLPREMEESAVLDGCNLFQIYYRIVLPLTRPALATVGIYTALSTWNEFLMALIFIKDPARRTLPLGMLAFQGMHNTEYHLLLSGLMISTVPIMLIYFVFQKQIVEGLTAGALKE